MSHPWWKIAPTPAPMPKASSVPWSDEAPNQFSTTKLRCSAEGCTFESSDLITSTLGPGVRPYCQHHATGGEMKIRDMLWRLPCACGKFADGYQQAIGGFTGLHSERKCILKTVAAAPQDVTVPLSVPAPPADKRIAGERKCACGKQADGTVNAFDTLKEWHFTRECVEQIVKALPEPPGGAGRPPQAIDPADALLLIGDGTIQELLRLVHKLLPVPRLQVLALAAALQYAASEGEVPDAYIQDALKASRRMVDRPDSKPH